MRGMARLGAAWLGMAGLGWAWPGSARRGEARWLNLAASRVASARTTYPEREARQGVAGLGVAWLGLAGQGKVVGLSGTGVQASRRPIPHFGGVWLLGK
jgi:hypothetical protein